LVDSETIVWGRVSLKTTTKKYIPSEHQEQVGFINWWKKQFPSMIIFSIPNGGRRAMSVAKKLKAEGLTPGVPDLFCPKLNLWVEMKRTKGGKLSVEQEKMIAYLRRIGHNVIVGLGATDASAKVLKFLEEREKKSITTSGKSWIYE
jgi:hypothetical protein